MWGLWAPLDLAHQPPLPYHLVAVDRLSGTQLQDHVCSDLIVHSSTAILSEKYRISSELRSQATAGPVSTTVGDHVGIRGAVGSLFCFLPPFCVRVWGGGARGAGRGARGAVLCAHAETTTSIAIITGRPYTEQRQHPRTVGLYSTASSVLPPPLPTVNYYCAAVAGSIIPILIIIAQLLT
jgi:hypothetical protein